MPSAPSASWVTECAACHHSNPARAHFCNVCGAPLQSPAAAASRAAEAARPGAAPATATAHDAAADVAEPKGFMLHFNDDNTLAIAPRYTSPDPGDAETATGAATAHGGMREASSTIHAAAARHGELHFSLPAPQAQENAAPAASRFNVAWNGPTVAAAMLALTALVGTGSYLLGRGSAPAAVPSYEAMQLATQPAAATAVPALQGAAPLAVAQPLGTAPVGGGNAVADSLAQAQQALSLSQANAAAGTTVAPMAPRPGLPGPRAPT